jgi:hypothetical protein
MINFHEVTHEFTEFIMKFSWAKKGRLAIRIGGHDWD